MSVNPQRANWSTYRPASHAQVIDLGPLRIRVLVGERGVGGAIEMFEFTAAAGAPSPPPHVHRTCSETFHVLEGVMLIRAGDEEHEVRAGDVVHIAAGIEHAFSYPERVTTRMVTTFSPGIGMVKYFEELRDLLARTPVDAQQLTSLMERHDTWLVRR